MPARRSTVAVPFAVKLAAFTKVDPSGPRIWSETVPAVPVTTQLTPYFPPRRMTGATLVIAKLDRLSRSVAFLAALMDSGAEFVAADMPLANRLTVHILAAVAEHEREAISARTKAAMAAAKARGRVFGNPNGAAPFRRAEKGNVAAVAAEIANADNYAADIRPIIEDIRAGGITSLQGIAQELTKRGILTARGTTGWDATRVRRLLARASGA